VSLRGLPAGYWCALRYAVNTDAGTLPLSLTVTPAWRAQERISALLGAPVDRAALALRDLPAPAPLTLAPARCFALADRALGFVVG
jgi:precorrin-3B methylase